jgi:hypothetical protein
LTTINLTHDLAPDGIWSCFNVCLANSAESFRLLLDTYRQQLWMILPAKQMRFIDAAHDFAGGIGKTVLKPAM